MPLFKKGKKPDSDSIVDERKTKDVVSFGHLWVDLPDLSSWDISYSIRATGSGFSVNLTHDIALVETCFVSTDPSEPEIPPELKNWEDLHVSIEITSAGHNALIRREREGVIGEGKKEAHRRQIFLSLDLKPDEFRDLVDHLRHGVSMRAALHKDFPENDERELNGDSKRSIDEDVEIPDPPRIQINIQKIQLPRQSIQIPLLIPQFCTLHPQRRCRRL